MPTEKENEVKPIEEKKAQPSENHPESKRVWLPIGLVIVGILLLGFAFAAGRHAAYYHTRFISAASSLRGDRELSPGQFGGMPGGMLGGGGYNSSSTTSNTRVSGVVTAVDGSTLTVAGNGTTSKVSVSSNTTYVGSSEPAKVNDSIVAFGAKDGSGTLVASTVRLSRQ